MNRLPAIIILLFIFSSCADHSKNEMAVYKAAAESLSRANENISNQTLYWYRSIEEKLHSIDDREPAEIWQPKANY